MMRLQSYRLASVLASLLLLAFAFMSKYYNGPLAWFSNAYLGDLFIVGTLYFWASALLPQCRPRYKAATILVFAVSVELFQLSGIPSSWNLAPPFIFILGSRFDTVDFLFYGLGVSLAVLVDVFGIQRFIKIV